MINRKVLYGYQIRNGALEIVPEEQRAVSMVFTLYNAGASYQAISDALNRQSIPYCREVPLWNKHKVKRLLENPRYTGKEGYPILVEADIFQAAQEKTAALLHLGADDRFYSKAEADRKFGTAYTLPCATAAVLGGVKAGRGVTVGADGTLEVTREHIPRGD